MKAHDIRETMSSPPQWRSDDGDAEFWILESFDKGSFWMGRTCGRSPWTRHADGDALLYTVEGEVEVTVLTDDGPICHTVRAGSAFVVPRGLWHRQECMGSSVQFGTTPGEVEHSEADDPRGSEA